MDNSRKIEEQIELLPQNFSEASGILKEEIMPLIAELEQSAQEHFLSQISKRVGTNKKAVSELFHESISLLEKQEDETLPIVDPEVAERIEEIANDPQLFRKRMEAVQSLGVSGEFKNIGVTLTTIDSRLNPAKQTLAAKNSGLQGGGKSHTTLTALKLYPSSAYFEITSASAKSLYGMGNELRHRVLVVSEAQVLEKDNDVTYGIRSLLSEGYLTYTRRKMVNGQMATVVEKVPGPMSFITTTIKGQLEKQMDDRLLTIHPDTSEEQTERIMRDKASSLAGNKHCIDEDTLKAWQAFHDFLESYDVEIPFAEMIAENMNKSDMPVTARRAYARVMHAVKSIALVHQQQRELSDRQRLIAEMPDYFLAYQLFRDIFLEDIGQTQRITDKKLQILEERGPMPSGQLAREAGITKATLSDWIKRNIAAEEISWCDKEGKAFESELALKNAQRKGSAHLKLTKGPDLPSPYQVTRDPRWDVGGEFYELYHLGLNNPKPEGVRVLEQTSGNRDYTPGEQEQAA